jgi:hypothetical protein
MKTGEVHDALGTPHHDASLKQQRGSSGVYTAYRGSTTNQSLVYGHDDPRLSGLFGCHSRRVVEARHVRLASLQHEPDDVDQTVLSVDDVSRRLGI